MAKHKFSIPEVREYLLEHGPHTTGELVSALKIRSAGTFGRIMALHAEGAGLIRFRQLHEGRLRVFWKADPYYRAPYQSTATKPEPVFPPRPEQESAERLQANIRRFRLERQQEKGGRRNA